MPFNFTHPLRFIRRVGSRALPFFLLLMLASFNQTIQAENSSVMKLSTELINGESIDNITAGQAEWLYFTLEVPSGATDLKLNISGGSGDADLYLKYGAEPRRYDYDCRPYLNGNNETCTVSEPLEGTYHVKLHAYHNFENVSLVGSYTVNTVNEAPVALFNYSCQQLKCQFDYSESYDPDGNITRAEWDFGDQRTWIGSVDDYHHYYQSGVYLVTLTVFDNEGLTSSITHQVDVELTEPEEPRELFNNMAVPELMLRDGNSLTFKLTVIGVGDLSFQLSGGEGDADLYVKEGAVPTKSDYDCRPYKNGNDELCYFGEIGGDRYYTFYVTVNAHTAFSGAKLLPSYKQFYPIPIPDPNPEPKVFLEKSNLTGEALSVHSFTFESDAKDTIWIKTWGGPGNVDLYVRFDNKPTEYEFDCRPMLPGNDEICTFDRTSAGTWYIDVVARTQFEGLNLKAWWKSFPPP